MKKILVACLIAVIGCTSYDIELGTIELSKWKKDKIGCDGYRSEHIKQIENNKSNLLRKGEREITLALGSPERTELYEKSQKFYFYYLTSGNECDNSTSTSIKILRLRFNALGYCNEALLIEESLDS